MDKEEFKNLLIIAELNQAELAEMLSMTTVGVSKWNKEGKYPAWLKDYLKGYIARTKLKDLKTTIDNLDL